MRLIAAHIRVTLLGLVRSPAYWVPTLLFPTMLYLFFGARVAAPDARFRMPGWNFELALGTRRLTRLIGRDAARDLLIDTKVVAASDALACGLVTDMTDPQDWASLIDSSLRRASTLPRAALRDMLDLTTADTRGEDIAAIVATAGRPGLKDRIIAYRNAAIGKKGKLRAPGE